MKRYDFIVAGGGLTGVAAAVGAAREGLKVLLAERSGCLGGAMSNCLIYPFMQYWDDDPEDGRLRCFSAGIFTEMRKRQLEKAGDDMAKLDPKQFQPDPEYFKLILDDMVEEAGVDVLFHAHVCAVNTEGEKVISLEVSTKSGLVEAQADYFADCTGDGDLFYLAGCEYQLGRDGDNLCQPMTTCFRMGGVDMELFREEREEIQRLYKQYQAEGKIENPRENVLMFLGLGEGIIHFNTTRVVRHDPTDAFELSRAEIMARRQVFEMVDFLRKHFRAFEKSRLLAIASDIGVRESRKLKGLYVLTGEELIDCVPFEDAVALGNYAIDIHNPAGTGTQIRYPKEGGYYQIPYRCMLPKEYGNLLVAGRCISTTHEAQAAVRIMPICACLGEAAGLAAGIACRDGRSVKEIDVQELRRKLRQNGILL